VGKLSGTTGSVCSGVYLIANIRIDEAVKLQRDKYMVRGRDMVGAVVGDDHSDTDFDAMIEI